MSKITSGILKAIAPNTPQPLRDRFIPFLNEALPRYGIVSEFQVAAFLATAAFESMYFRKTREGKAKSTSPVWIKYQSKYWPTGYFGRGIFQTTTLANYRKFGQKMKKRGLVDDSELFVKQPELLEQPKWAVESACEFWETNKLDQYARQGLKGFSALQGVVNRGRPDKVALGYADRLVVYEAARLALPDDFKLSAADTETPATQSPLTVEPFEPAELQPIQPPTSDRVVIEDREKQGFFQTIWKKLTAKFGGDVTLAVATEKAKEMQLLGLDADTWRMIFYIGVAAGVLWLLFEAYKYYMRVTEQTAKTAMLVTANTTPTNRVEIANTDVLQEYRAKGYTVITR